MKEGYIKKEDRKKILLITDDIRVHSGVAQIGRELVFNSSHKYNWVQMAGAVEHPDMGKIIDISEEIKKHKTEIEDPYCILYPVKGYGDFNMLNEVIQREKPDALFLITDPRYFAWLFHNEDQLRKKMPIAYLNIWDNYPAPMYNKEYYESCDLLMGISKQTVNINKLVLGDKGKNKIFKYVPHGLNDKIFDILEDDDIELVDFKEKIGLPKDNKFHLLFNSRNIRRKQVSNIIMAYKIFTDKLSPKEAKECQLTLKTEAVFDHGTDLNAVIEYFCDENSRVGILDNKLNSQEMNLLYNSADCVIQISNAEGWGLSLTEAMLTGTPFIAAVTGGMQDQMRFEDEKGNWIEFNDEFPSNHRGKYKKHGEWAFPVYTKTSTLVGSPATPYIYDDHHDINDVVDQMMKLYKMSKKERKAVGKKGYDWAKSDEAGFTSEKMTNKIINGMDELFSTWKPREKYTFLKDTDHEKRVLPHKLIY